MLHTLRRKIAGTVSKIPPPENRVVFDTLRSPPTSNNICIQIDPDGQTSSHLDLNVVRFKLPWQPTLEIRAVEWWFESTQLLQVDDAEPLTRPEITESLILFPVFGLETVEWEFDHEALSQIEEADLLIDSVSTEIAEWRLNKPKILRPSRFLSAVWIGAPSPLNIEPVSTFDCFEIFEHSVPISKDLFERLEVRRPEGKHYGRSREERQPSLFSDISVKEKPFPAIRKAYTETKVSSTVTERQTLTIWDLLYPILLPPLSFDFGEQVDLFRPLYKYQKRGIEFLVDHPAALLADEMGTGKTVMSLVALRLLFRQGLVKRVLIVCPSSIVGSARLSQITGSSEGWDGHLYHWAPELKVTVVRGTQAERQKDWRYDAHVFVTTYDTLRSDLESNLLEETAREFDCVIVDEAQNIKNAQSGRAKAVRSLKANYHWALTGTPIQNRVEDVVAIFDFLKPEVFKGQPPWPQHVKQKIEPYFLRRLKRDVMSKDWFFKDFGGKRSRRVAKLYKILYF